MKHIRPLTHLPNTAKMSINELTELENLLAIITMGIYFIGEMAKMFTQEQ